MTGKANSVSSYGFPLRFRQEIIAAEAALEAASASQFSWFKWTSIPKR